MTESTCPLFVLQPLPGEKGATTALRIIGAGVADTAAVVALLNQAEFIEASAGLQLLLPAQTIAALAGATDITADITTLHADTHHAPAATSSTGMHSGPAATILLKLLGQLTSDAETRDIESTLKQDPQLSLQLLRLVNSAAFAPSSRIASFSQAINLLGRRQLQRWLQLLMFARGQSPDQINPLLPRAAMRAALMEALSKATGGSREACDEAYMVGMFSLLEQLFGQPLAAILGNLQLAPEIAAALLQHAGRLGQLLALIEASEQCGQSGTQADTAAVAAALAVAAIDADTWCKAQIAALLWAQQISRGV